MNWSAAGAVCHRTVCQLRHQKGGSSTSTASSMSPGANPNWNATDILECNGHLGMQRTSWNATNILECNGHLGMQSMRTGGGSGWAFCRHGPWSCTIHHGHEARRTIPVVAIRQGAPWPQDTASWP
jgi:hypothetical protein